MFFLLYYSLKLIYNIFICKKYKNIIKINFLFDFCFKKLVFFFSNKILIFYSYFISDKIILENIFKKVFFLNNFNVVSGKFYYVYILKILLFYFYIICIFFI